MHELRRQAIDGVRAAVSLTVVYETATTRSFAHGRRKILPLGDRTEAFVQKHDGRCVAGRTDSTVLQPGTVNRQVLASERSHTDAVSVEPHVVEVGRPAVDADAWRRDPVRELAGLRDAPRHQRLDERVVLFARQ